MTKTLASNTRDSLIRSAMQKIRIYKYIHSCFLVEQAGEKLLFDPGKFSFVEGRVKPVVFNDVSMIVITHHYPDHVHVESVKQVLAQSGARIVGNGEVASTLREQEIEVSVLEEGTQRFGPFTLRAIPARHEPILSNSLPRNTAFLVNERVLNPSDSFQSSLLAFKGVELLILPIMAPWLTELAVADFAHQMQPRHVLAAHDGYARDFFLKQRHETYRPYFEKLGIQFHAPLEPGACVTLYRHRGM